MEQFHRNGPKEKPAQEPGPADYDLFLPQLGLVFTVLAMCLNIFVGAVLVAIILFCMFLLYVIFFDR